MLGGCAGRSHADFIYRELSLYSSNTYHILRFLQKFIGKQDFGEKIVSKVLLIALATLFMTPYLVKF